MPDALIHGGLGAAGTALLAILWAAFVRRNEKNEDKVEADKEGRLVHCELALEKHRELLQLEREKRQELQVEVAELKSFVKFIKGDHDMVIDHESRLRRREGLQGSERTGITRLDPGSLEDLRKRHGGGDGD